MSDDTRNSSIRSIGGIDIEMTDANSNLNLDATTGRPNTLVAVDKKFSDIFEQKL